MPNVHKDFHGALSYGIEFLSERYGREELCEFFGGLADSVYKSLVEDIRRRGLIALHNHWENIFSLEDGKYSLTLEADRLTLEVSECPAIAHMKKNSYTIAARFCEHTHLTNKAICQAAGYECSVEYDQTKGQCVQCFWKKG